MIFTHVRCDTATSKVRECQEVLGVITQHSHNCSAQENSTMLVWEEEAKPAAVHTTALHNASLAKAVVAHAAHVQPAAVAVEVTVQTKPVAVTSTRRVQAADKRIINGQTDVNQLVPFKYKWAWEKY
ncbi:MAG: hypothetical protein ABUL50_10570, partial [Rhizobacter sp.]